MSEAKHEDNYGRDVLFWSDEHYIYLGTFDLEKLQGYLVAGINRVSLGVQVFDDRLLSSIGRSHSLQDVYNAIQILKRAGVENFSIDLISGLPNQTLNDWKETIEAALSFDPPHIAVYDLMVEQKTAFDKWGYVPGLSPLPSEKDSTNMYRYASNTLQQEGFKHYEISNYAKSGFECEHNRVYWENKPFLAFGMGAASYLQGFRFSRPRKLDDYLLFVNEELRSCEDWTNYMQRVRENASQLHHPNLEELTDKVMLGLRLREGLDIESIGIHYGTNVVDSILEGAQTAITMGHAKVEIDPNSGNIQRLRLVDPDGFMISSEIIANIFSYLN